MKMHGLLNSARALALAVGLFAAQDSLAQKSTGALSGRVAATDKVTIRNVGTGLVKDIEVKADGTFLARHLPTGTYEVTIKAADGSEEKLLAAARIGTTTASSSHSERNTPPRGLMTRKR
jgi:hypothetical protein